MRSRAGRIFWNLAWLFFLATLPAFAAEGGDATTTPLGWTFRWIHFAIIFGLIAYTLAVKAPPFFRARAEGIASAIADSGKGRAAGEQRKKEAAEKLAGLEKEVAAMRSSASEDAAAELERIRAGAGEEVAKIEGAAGAEIAAAARAARSELKAATARRALGRAEGDLARQMTPANEGAIFRAFVEEMERGGSLGSRN